MTLLRGRPLGAALWAAQHLLPLRAGFAALRWLARGAPDREPAAWHMRVAAAALDLEGEALRDWYRRLWWGREACLAAEVRLRRKATRVLARLVADIDWTPLEQRLAQRRGVLAIGAHMGPHFIARWAAARRFDQSLFVAVNVSADTEGIAVRDPAQRAVALANSIFHLRRGGMVVLAGDGAFGERALTTAFLGCPVTLRRGPAALARASGAVTLPVAAGWKDDRVVVHFGPPIEPCADRVDAEAWEAEWLRLYVGWLEGRMLGAPEDLRMKGGIWGMLRDSPVSQIRRIAAPAAAALPGMA